MSNQHMSLSHWYLKTCESEIQKFVVTSIEKTNVIKSETAGELATGFLQSIKHTPSFQTQHSYISWA
jgi:hypothetical protein